MVEFKYGEIKLSGSILNVNPFEVHSKIPLFSSMFCGSLRPANRNTFIILPFQPDKSIAKRNKMREFAKLPAGIGCVSQNLCYNKVAAGVLRRPDRCYLNPEIMETRGLI